MTDPGDQGGGVIDVPADERPQAWLVRHGETEWSKSGQHTGRTDVPLTEAGVAQATALRERLGHRRFALVLASPLSRALDTARLAGYGDVLEVDGDLREWNYGAAEGRTTDELRATIPEWTIWTHGAKGAETLDEVAARVDRVIERVRTAEGDAALFAHGHVLRILTARWLDRMPPLNGRHFALGTATISVLGWEREMPVIERWNEPVETGG